MNALRGRIDDQYEPCLWQPAENFTSGLRRTVIWYLNNRAWCTHVQDGSYQRERLGLSVRREV